jgi:hypothetical protein
MKNTDDSLWESTAVQNLFRYRPSGTYFARFKVGCKPIRQGLETSVFSVAKQRLPDKIREYRSRHESIKAFASGKMTVGDATEVYLQKINPSASKWAAIFTNLENSASSFQPRKPKRWSDFWIN